MDEETSALFSEIIALLQDAQLEMRAMRQILTGRGLIGEEELEREMAAVRRAEFSDLTDEARRRAFEKTLATRLKQ